ncbi:hypothetical protein MNBD_GAMMA03-2078 [hydrothermal vent metagenome]|uniref:Methyltransferase type 11 domain-containing protein n=1 Tax=hydrothermal vent metagenome TaxID=652676 RepID=A0A3B0VZ79_9ZZZZ
MNQQQLEALLIPDNLIELTDGIILEDSLITRENELLKFFSEQYAIFTQYPNYFKLRTYEFRILKQLLPEYFNINKKYETFLEIGCNFGYKSILLSPYAKLLKAIDIPQEYQGCILGNFKRTTDIAKILVNEKFKINNVVFDNVWPDDLKLEDESVDMIFSEYVLEHIPELSKAIGEMYRVLRSGGVMIHVVPNTKDAVYPFVEANTQITFRKMLSIIKSTMGAWIKKEERNTAHMRWNGTIVPPCHSEHTHSFMKQVEIYTLENYLFPMLEAGFKIEKIFSTREHNHVLVIRK